MNLTVTKDEFRLLRDFVEKECGISLDEDKTYLIESRLAGMVIENGCQTFGEFYLKAKADTGSGLKDKIVDAMTTNETLWFRDDSPFIVLKERLFPEFISQIESKTKSQIRIWSAACSTGQEPYSIGITAHEFSNRTGAKTLSSGGLSILATDISPSALHAAKNAKYNPIAMSRGMPSDLKERYFEQQGSTCVLKETIKNMVEFRQFNLQSDFSSLGKFDVVMLRNVAIYFSFDFKVALFKKIAQVLNPQGYLFLGASENLLGCSDDFKMIEHGRCIFYQLKN